ncbi:hypothetical protein GOP47_0004522 [Adiantum capillus-veneris]|uniref:S1 motif domain-containing protein n=1 Tax=Adiantum capillus-veneris TaxID=13818 RepID=A0A9D4ZPN2_ADICA|nr:hypothetical protein GOP47_0004520 [Adiantum capillus-veneris]KAI5081339.1 hypothetical protein GOP47_0004522 [Adiantum capillus-veneris]
MSNQLTRRLSKQASLLSRALKGGDGLLGRSQQSRSFMYLAGRDAADRKAETKAYMRLGVRGIRREPISQAQRNAELEEEAKRIDLAPHKLLEKGEPGTMQAIIKDVMPVGYFLTLPTGREGYLPALDLGFTGGIVILERLFKVGQELTVRVVRRGGGGREILSIKKPEFAPNTDPRYIFSQRWGNSGDKPTGS